MPTSIELSMEWLLLGAIEPRRVRRRLHGAAGEKGAFIADVALLCRLF
jgi:hypothetical protein